MSHDHEPLWPAIKAMMQSPLPDHENSYADRCPIERQTSKQRSRVTNHGALLPNLDGRSASARRYRDLIRAYINDCGGPSEISEIKLGLLRRLAATTVQVELLEASMVNGQPIDISVLCTLASTVLRLSLRLSIERVPKPVNDVPDPLSYAAVARQQEAAL